MEPYSSLEFTHGLKGNKSLKTDPQIDGVLY